MITYLVDDSDEHLKHNEIGEEKPTTQKYCCNNVLLVLCLRTHLYFTSKHIGSKTRARKGRTVSYTISVQFSDEKICMILSERKLERRNQSLTWYIPKNELYVCENVIGSPASRSPRNNCKACPMISYTPLCAFKIR